MKPNANNNNPHHASQVVVGSNVLPHANSMGIMQGSPLEELEGNRTFNQRPHHP